MPNLPLPIFTLGLVLAAAAPLMAASAADSTELDAMQRQLEEMKKDYEQRIRSLERRLNAAETSPPATASALDRALAETEPERLEKKPVATPGPGDLWSRQLGGSTVRLMDFGAVLDVAAGWSSTNNDNIEHLQGGAHDPQRRGFTLQQLELAMKGAIDPYFTGAAHILFSEEGAELEEAFFTTTSLPYSLQLEGGYFLTEFGRNNPRHPDQWYWIDQPVINTRLFGGEGTRAAGFRLSGLLPTPWYSALHFGMQDPTSETAVSFMGQPPGHAHGQGHDHEGDGAAGEEGLGGFARIGENAIQSPSDLLYLSRWVNGGDITSAWSAQLGLSVLYGPNTTGPDGETWIYGADLMAKWRPALNFRGWPFLLWQSEFMKRDYQVDQSNSGFEPGETDDSLRDWGLYTELLYGFKYQWSAGLRFEYATGSGNGEDARNADPFRSDRYRVSPLLTFHPSEFSRIRLQYNYDNAEYLKAQDRDENVHSLWLGFEYILGSHPPHEY
ncbi:MAG: hypothetical protein WA970_10695 [Gammaproteobacteria bacterium]